MNNSNDLYGSEYDSEDDEGFCKFIIYAKKLHYLKTVALFFQVLTPVLHYDISNKIKEANKTLFEESAQQTSSNMDEANRRVTFSKDLVSYAPHVVQETTTTTTASDDEEEISIKEELESITLTTIEKISELNEIIKEIDKEINLEQVNATTKLENKNKSALLLDAPLTRPVESKENEECEAEKPTTTEAVTTSDEQSVDKKVENAIEDEEESNTNDTLSMQVGVLARKQIRQEIKEKKNPLPQAKKSSNLKRENKKVSTPKFNYKICCEYQQSRLPQYKGHISEYGLSLRERERLLHLHKRQERNLLEHETRIQNESLHRLTANEKAFGAWLINKCRNAPNRTRNMFDCSKSKKKNAKHQQNKFSKIF